MSSNNKLDVIASATTPARRNPLTIAFLFYIVTLSSIIAAILSRLTFDENVTSRALGAAMVAGAGFGLLVGLFVGLTRFKTWRAAFLGLGLGTLLGCCAGAIAMVSADHFASNMLAAFGGGWFIILIMLISARYQHRVE